MKKAKYISLLAGLLLCFGIIDVVKAQPIKYAQSGMPFLKIDVGGRAAMGGTHVGQPGDAMSMFYNPAGLARVNGFEVMSSVTNWIADINHYAVGAAYNLSGVGTFGVGIIWMDYGTFTRTVPVSFEVDQAGYQVAGQFEVAEYAVGLSYARQITDRFYFGSQIKFAKQDLGDLDVLNPVSGVVENRANRVDNIVLDFGTLFYPGFKDFRFGLSLRNFSNQADYFDQRFELPITFNFGAAMDVLALFRSGNGEGSNSRLTLALDWVHPREYSERLHTGIEYALAETIFLRGGYKFNYDEEGLTAGVALKKGLENVGLMLDYSYADFGIFDSVSRFSVGIFVNK